MGRVRRRNPPNPGRRRRSRRSKKIRQGARQVKKETLSRRKTRRTTMKAPMPEVARRIGEEAASRYGRKTSRACHCVLCQATFVSLEVVPKGVCRWFSAMSSPSCFLLCGNLTLRSLCWEEKRLTRCPGAPPTGILASDERNPTLRCFRLCAVQPVSAITAGRAKDHGEKGKPQQTATKHGEPQYRVRKEKPASKG